MLAQGLWHLENLLFLDLSNNKIEKLDANELPSTLKVIRVSGNPCAEALKDVTSQERKDFLDALPWLEKLDEEAITKQSRRECGLEVSDSESEDLTAPELGALQEQLGLGGAEKVGSLDDIDKSTGAALGSAVKGLQASMKGMLARLQETEQNEEAAIYARRGLADMERQLKELRSLPPKEIARRAKLAAKQRRATAAAAKTAREAKPVLDEREPVMEEVL